MSQPLALPWHNIHISSRLGNTPREIALPDGQLFISDDNDSIDALINSASHRSTSNLLFRLESNLPLILFATAFTCLFVWATMTYGIPKSAQMIAQKLPHFAGEKLGTSLSILDKTLFTPTQLDDTRQQQIALLLQPYIDSHYAKHPEVKPQLFFRSAKHPNAFALPGGEIVFTDEFVHLTEKDEELIAVFLHELGHLKHQHIMRRVLQDGMVTLLVIMITGDVDSVDLLTGLPTLILDLSYSREFETEADLYALSQMHEHNIPLHYFSDIMQRFQQASVQASDRSDNPEPFETSLDWSIPDFLSTHPPTQDRVDLVHQFKQQHNLQ